MSDDRHDVDADIIRAAYSDKVKEAWVVFADNLSVGQAEKSCKDRFLRSLGLVKKARDLALAALIEEQVVEAEAPRARPVTDAAETSGLSAEDQAMVDAALSGTTGLAKPVRLR